MKKIKDMVPIALENSEVLRASRAQAVLRRWPEVVGTMLAARSHPDRYDRGTIWVAVEGSAWAQEMRMLEEKFLFKLNEMAREPGMFREIRFGVRPLPARPVAEEEVAPPAPEEVDLNQLSIREIAQRRLARWKHEGRD